MTSAKALMCVNLLILFIIVSSALLCKEQSHLDMQHTHHTYYSRHIALNWIVYINHKCTTMVSDLFTSVPTNYNHTCF
jgi:hypothetical protein